MTLAGWPTRTDTRWMTDPGKGIERDLDAADDEATDEEAPQDVETAAPVDLGATVTLSPEALAALLEEVKKGKRQD
jgi:hypothetical protein